MDTSFIDIAKSFAKLNIIKHNLYHSLAKENRLNPCQMQIIEFLLERPGSTQVEIANKLMVTPASITLTTKRMEKQGLITKEVDRDNLRCKKLFATELAEELYNTNIKIFRKVDRILFEGLPESTISQLNQNLNTAVENSLKNCTKVLSEKEMSKITTILKKGGKQND
ncbi:MAG: winged helix-turn-helix transcriptional regulator [Clostridia bacterium]|nr:winged helix-turn-helix transcriptional regulator [Clostridia bacterium]MBQ7075167.1 winged helix-turn-helix transcriptional regulator [Clostridia bacterium]MBQ9997425.1 winged helix-turn-helix transcriptional regulator [Clostridia bacterium]